MTETAEIEHGLILGFIDGLRPEIKMSVTDWANTYRILPAVAASEPGLYRSSRTPYCEKIMNALSPHSGVREIIFMKCSQIGGTEIGNNWIGCIIHTAPGGILLISPTDSNAKRNSKIRIEPMIKSSPVLRDRIKSSRVREGGNTVYQKDFPNGFLVMCGSNSTADIKSLPCRYIGLDEVDEYPTDLDGQGSVIELSTARARNFPMSKLYLNSTPTLQDTSIIAKEFEDTDQQHYHLPCPECGTYQKLEFSQLKWEKGNYKDVKYQCMHCSYLIPETMKTELMSIGRWVAECPEKIDPQRVGFHINALYSPWFGWGRICRTYDRAQGNEPKMRTFHNTILGLPWGARGEQPDYNMVFNKREGYAPNIPPVGVCFITAGADIQKDRIEIEIVGWGKGKRSWSIDYRILHGETNQVYVWNDLAKIVYEIWRRADGVELPMRLMCVDSGYNQSYVYDFCRRFDLSRVVPTRGDDRQGVIIGSPRLVDHSREGKRIGSIRAWNVGVSILKSELYGWLRLEKDEEGNAPPGYCHFPNDGHYSGKEYFKGLCSEQLEVKNDKGVPKYTWVRKYHNNEPLDCRNYARAAASMLQIDRFQDEHYELMAGVVKKTVERKTRREDEDWL